MSEQAQEFIRLLEPLSVQGNGYASYWLLRMHVALGDEAAEQAVIDEVAAVFEKVATIVGRVGQAISEAFGGIDFSVLAERFAAAN